LDQGNSDTLSGGGDDSLVPGPSGVVSERVDLTGASAFPEFDDLDARALTVMGNEGARPVPRESGHRGGLQ
jgi:hypothetical protein